MKYLSEYDRWVTTDGKVFRRGRGNEPEIVECWQQTCHNGYKLVYTCQGKRGVHTLVAKAYLPNPENKPSVDHINRVRTDNRVENLRWATTVEQATNTARVDKEIAKYGVRACEDITTYRRNYSRVYCPQHREHRNRLQNHRYHLKRVKQRIREDMQYKDGVAYWSLSSCRVSAHIAAYSLAASSSLSPSM